MARILQGPGHSPSQRPSSTRRPAPDYEAEADRGRLELGGDALDRMAFSRDGGRTLGGEIAAASQVDETDGATSYDVQSRGGFARVVTGTVAYVDEEARTYMVSAPDGELFRVPIRDIRAMRANPGGRDDPSPYDALDGVAESRADDRITTRAGPFPPAVTEATSR